MREWKQAAFVAAFFALACIIFGVFISIEQVKSYELSTRNACVDNLRIINKAKQRWALEHGKTNSNIPTWADIKPYVGPPGSELPKCPSGGVYTLGAMSNLPTCSVPGHALSPKAL
jgi:hypothetical protein